MAKKINREFPFMGVNHVALVCKDMARTVEFYRDVLGMPLIKTLNLPGDRGQHFFFDCGNGDAVAFFWFRDAPPPAPGIAAPSAMPTRGSFVSAMGSMNHLAFNVAADRFDECHARLLTKGIDVTIILNHDNSPTQVSKDLTDEVYVRSMYFFDPDGICLEIAAWTGEFDQNDALVAPVTASGLPVAG